MALEKLDFGILLPESQLINKSDEHTFMYRLHLSKEVLKYTFGMDWLEARVSRGKQRHLHPFQLLWRELCSLDKPQLKQNEVDSARYSKDLGYLVAPLSYACMLHGFKDCVLPRLKDINYYEPALFEVFVACKFNTEGSLVEFVIPDSTPNQKTPDLQVQRHGFTMFVECKKNGLS